MNILKILNNNVAVTHDKMGQEIIVMGKGIAYQKKVGDSLDQQSIDKIYSLSNKDAFVKFQELLSEIPIDYFEVADQIINYAKLTLGKNSMRVYIYRSVTIFSRR